MAEQTPLKTQLGPAAVEQLAAALKSVYPDFDAQGFISQANHHLDELELKGRVRHLIAVLAAHLPCGFCETARILEQVAEAWPEQPQGQWSSFTAWPLIDYVSVYGLDYPQRAFSLLEKLTPLFTAEFAIRSFLNRHFELTHQQLLQWTRHDNEHVRRLASEGIRPRLPWAQQLPALRKDPTPIWLILEALKTDPSLYVRRSVANNLNDISKDHPEAVMMRCREWQQLQHKNTDWLISHGLRTLVKSGRAEVYPLLGFSDKPVITAIGLQLSETQIKLGDALRLTLTLTTQESERLVVDYRIGYRRADGRLGWKVFKWKNIRTQGGEPLTLTKSQTFKPLSTRRYYPGEHLVECLINGQMAARAGFQLSV
ncbi:DNA alkylation repair protein [Methylophaga sp.]|uniref:DNA alkylation repair protein n=1 Tax=Methylophaga sp. TaxID=2024840 RepID=UPI00140053D6|nr:DNA alkylation repair protein [Methylophaga sp.]MTI64587.1 DNA alkylation repair protein [Methylophaga sp.]